MKKIMIKKKVCMLGAFAVGKTSLIKQFVENIFSQRYHTTLGVKIDKKSVEVAGEAIDLILWDLAGEDDFIAVKMSYLRGAAGYLIVADGTRKDSLATAFDLIARAEKEIGKLPYVLLINKSDLAGYWQITDEEIRDIEARGNRVFKTSAKTGENVEAAFKVIAEAVVTK
jgi:small GTP-binding protein